ncbi:MAG: hypothetical protein FP820_12395 [Sulfurimonas sp.]|nr:hypothetical protein [Sulfurimonas sp.]MBU1216780.1 hypothetical protein [bacterium]MBU1434907.1 hypothetical protein [bacterium]MBU1504012.1 hypothetical protein [bacterium]MBU3938639.1 hypothetical protein [bacterium]
MIQRLFLLLLVLSVLLRAKEYNDTVMDIEAKLFPKIALLEERIANNPSPYLTIAIIYTEPDYNVAQNFKQKIESCYPNKLRDKKVLVTLAQFGLSHIVDTDALLVLSHEPRELEIIALWANKNKIVTFAYEPAFLEYGLTASIYIGKATKPYLNNSIIKKHGFVFDPYLLQLSKFTH